MLFSSISFLYVFLPIVLLSYFLVPYGVKNVVLLGASLIFYFAGEPIYTVLLIISTLSAYLHGLYIEAHRGLRRAKAALASSILINLGILGFFKYADFFIANWNGLTGGEISLLQIALPLGISFYTFQTMPIKWMPIWSRDTTGNWFQMLPALNPSMTGRQKQSGKMALLAHIWE